MRVRFLNGMVIEYPAATFVSRRKGGYTDLYTKKDGVWLVQVPTAECVVEPSATVARVLPDPLHSVEQTLLVLEHRDEKRRVDAYWLKRLKAALADVDGRSGKWRSR